MKCSRMFRRTNGCLYKRSITMNFKTCKGLTVFLLIALLAVFTAGCAVKEVGVQIGQGRTLKGGPPPHAPAHGYRAKYMYRYYPSAMIYFDITRKVYFYFAGGAWRVSVSLPANLKVRLGDHIAIEMDTDKPYRDFEKHKAKYPPGQLKKKKKKK